MFRRLNYSKDLWLLAGATFCLMFGFGIQMAIFTNFLVQRIGIKPHEMGWLESIREVPGFLTAFINGAVGWMPEPYLGGISLLVMAFGMGSYFMVSSIPGLVGVSFLWSVGFHTWSPLSASMILGLTRQEEAGKRLGEMGSIGALAGLSAMGLVYLISSRIDFRIMFLLAGACIAVSGLLVLQVRKDIGHPQRPRFLFRRRYGLYYLLTFLEGCRRQIFGTFAIFALVRVYHTQVTTVALLMIVNSLINLMMAPVVGRWIDRVGERVALTVNYIVVFFIFLGYATIHQAHVLYALYIADSFFFLLSMSVSIYLKKICAPEDMTPTLAMGTTWNHVAAVAVPVTGGYLWDYYGYEVAFYGGMLVVLISLVSAQLLRSAKPVSLEADALAAED
ncbi:MAG: MFS transporter [Armatimonadetes bacterium]|nr:MFS transporter [Armatimonadota bacterium]